MASVVPRPHTSTGTTSYQVRWRERGRQRSVMAEGATDKARRADAERIRRLVDAHGTYTETMTAPGVPTVREQLETFLAGRTRGNADTVGDYRRIYLQHIDGPLGDLAVSALTVPMLTDWALGLNYTPRGASTPRRVSDKTRANITMVMSGLLESAVPEHLGSNPWRKVIIPKTDGPKDVHHLSATDFALVLEEIPEHYRLLILVLALTGLRFGEARALTVADLNLTTGVPVFRVVKARKHGARKNDPDGTPKTAKAVRWVTGPAELTDVLRATIGDRPPTDRLLVAPRGGQIYGSTFHTLVWQPALDRAQRRGLTFRPKIRELRNAAVTWLLDAGMDAYEVADMMGHEDVSTTLQIYRRANPQAGAKATAAQSGILAQVLAPKTLTATPTEDA